MNFHAVKVNTLLKNNDLQELEENNSTKYMILLSELGELGCINIQNSVLYYIIDSEWNDLNKSLLFSCPKSPGS